jgi:CBS domain containing-hemolysin-like protein
MLGLFMMRAFCVAMLILANGFFVAAEFALLSLRETRIEQLLSEGITAARSVRKLQQNFEDFLPAAQFGVTLCSLALGWIGEPLLADIIESPLQALPDARITAHLIAVPVSFAFITYLHVLLGELVPKSLALRKAEQLALSVAAPMLIFINLTRPMVRFMRQSASVVLQAFGVPLVHEATVHSPEEIKLMATAARRSGILPAYQESIIHRALELESIETREIMTPRQRIFSLPSDMSIEEASARVVEEQHSRVPVYDPTHGTEHIIGIVYAKDLARLMHIRSTTRLRTMQSPFANLRLAQIMRDVLVVPETKPVADLLLELQQRRRHLAVVVDEYGTTVGLVTVEDAIEQVLGEIEDEFDVTTRPLLASNRNAVELDGSVNLRDLEMQMKWRLPRDGGVETLAGFLLAQLGHIPRAGESIIFEDRKLTIQQMEAHRISRVLVQRVAPAEPSDQKQLEAEEG